MSNLKILVVLALTLAACGGSAQSAPTAPDCPHHYHELPGPDGVTAQTGADGQPILFDDTPEEDRSICAYSAWLRAQATGEAGATQ